MSPELKQKLYMQYPNLYRKQLIERFTRTVECGNGWFNIVNTLSQKLENLILVGAAPGLMMWCIKEKYGTMRVQTEGAENNEEVEKIIEVAEQLSGITCEKCGVEGVSMRTGSWWKTLCDSCEENRQKNKII